MKGEDNIMKLEGKKVGVIITGAFGAFKKTIEQLENIIKEKAEIIPIMSYNAYTLDTKFGNSKDFINKVEKITRKKSNTYYSKC